MGEVKKSEIVKMDLSPKSQKSKENEENNKLAERHSKKIVKNDTMVKKESGIKKLYGVFFDEEPKDVISNVFKDTILPDLKGIITHAGTDAWDRMVNGENAGKSRRRSGEDTNYNKRYRSRGVRSRYEDERDDDEEEKAKIDFRDIVYESKTDAEDVMEGLLDALEDYDDVPIGTVYELAGYEDYIVPAHWNYGWTNLDDLRTINDRGDWKIKYPRARKL
jgi:hypothetical protein